MKIIFIRHGAKLYTNNGYFGFLSTLSPPSSPRGNDKFKDLHRHDSPLSEEGRKQVRSVAEELKEEETPDCIFVSPYFRTRETLLMLQNSLEGKLDTVPILTEPHISEFLGNQTYSDVKPETQVHSPPNHTETLEEFQERIRKFVEELYRYKENDNVSNVWVISHGFTLQNIAEEILRIDGFYIDEGKWASIII